MLVLSALIPTVMFAMTVLIMGYFGGNARQQNFGVTAGAGIYTLLMVPFIANQHWSMKALVVGFSLGLLWGIAQYFQVKALFSFGVSRTMPLSAGIQLILNGLIGVIVFKEWGNSTSRFWGITALVLVIIGIMLVNWHEGEKSISRVRLRQGLFYASCCGILFGFYPPVLRFFEINANDGFAPIALGLVTIGIVMAFILPIHNQSELKFYQKPATLVIPAKDKIFTLKTLWLSLAGGCWAVGNVFMLQTADLIGVATAFSASQLSVALSTVGGITLLGEKRTQKELIVVIFGVLLIVLGGCCLGLAKSYDLV